jgi:hypothetical protein
MDHHPPSAMTRVAAAVLVALAVLSTVAAIRG